MDPDLVAARHRNGSHDRGRRLRSWLHRAYPTLAVALATVVAGAIYLQAMLAHTGGHLGSPIDDAYIYFNYARHMAGGAPYEYNPGDGVSTGATSLLWTPLLALGYAVGFRGELIVLWAFLLSAICLLGYGVLLYRVGQRLLGSRLLGTLLAVAIVLEGRVLWGFWSGMEIGLYMLLQVATLYGLWRYQESRQRHTLWLLGLSLVGLTLVRPEGQFLALMVVAVFVAWRVLAGRSAEPPEPWRRALTRPEWLCAALPLVAIGVTYLLIYLTTGDISQNGMRTKSHLYAPDANPWEVLEASYKFYRDMIFRHFPWFFEVSLRHVLDLFLFFGFLYGIGRETRRRRPGPCWVMGLWFFVGLGIQSLVLNAAYHHGRYQMNYTFVFWLVLVWGGQEVLRLLRIQRWMRQFVLGGALALLLVMMVGTIVRYRPIYGKDVKTIQNQHVAMGRYVAAHVPAGAAVALNDAGAIAYYGNRYVYDLFGLTTNVAARWKWLGEACIFEQVQHLSPTGHPRRPDYFAIYDKWYPKLTGSGMLEELASFTAPDKSIAGGPKKTLYRIRWDAFGDESRSVTAARLRDQVDVHVADRLDVAYRPDEMAHRYVHEKGGHPSEKGSALLGYFPVAGDEAGRKIADGGRHVTESEAFTVSGLQPHQPLVVVRRSTGRAAPSHVLVDGRPSVRWPASSGSSRAFREDQVEIPADRIEHDRVRLSFEVDRTEPEAEAGSRRPKRARRRGPDRGYRVYYYWLLQPARPL